MQSVIPNHPVTTTFLMIDNPIPFDRDSLADDRVVWSHVEAELRGEGFPSGAWEPDLKHLLPGFRLSIRDWFDRATRIRPNG